MKAITKKQINAETRVTKGNGFLKFYRFNFNFNGWSFEKPMNYDCCTCIHKDNPGVSEMELNTRTKKEFVNEVYNFINSL